MPSRRHFFMISALFCALPLAAQNFSTKSYPAHGTNLLTADFNRDGFTDLLEYGGFGLPAFVAMNDGHGGFATGNFIDSTSALFVAIADFNHDGFPDIVTCASEAGPVNLYLNQSGTGKFVLAQSIPLPANTNCGGITVADINGDGKADVVVGVSEFTGSEQLNFLITYFGSGTGRLGTGVQQEVSLPITQQQFFTCFLDGLTAADYTGTGRYDLVVFAGCSFVADDGDLYYAKSDGNGHYTLSEISENTGFLRAPPRWANVNGDLLPDLAFVVSDFHHVGFTYNTFLATSQGNGKFNVQSPFGEDDQQEECTNMIQGADVADFNGDGHPDIVNSATVPPTACGSSLLPGVVLMTGNGQGTWQISQELDLPSDGASLPPQNADAVAADFNNDNRADFALITADQNANTFELLVYTNISAFSVNPCHASGPGAHLCAPSQGTGSSEHFTAAATGLTGPVRLMQLYVDGKKVGQFAGNQINTSVTLAVGTHTAQAVELEYNGEFTKSAPVSFTVKASGACSAPASAGVNICSPGTNAVVTSPVPFSAAAKAATGTTITAMRVYVDNVAKFTANGATLSTSISIAAGTHTIAVVGYEGNGAALKTTETISVH